MANLKQLLEKAANEYRERKAAAEAAAVRWEAFSATAYDPRPFYFERYNQTRGRALARPTPKSAQYGFDAAGRCVVAREPKSKGSPAYEEFFTHRGPTVESAAYRTKSGHQIFYVAQQKHSGRHIVACNVLDAGPADEEVCESYLYSAGRLKDIKVTASSGGVSKEHRFDVLYDDDGFMIAIRKFHDYIPKPWSYLPIYWNPQTAPSFDEMYKNIRQRLKDLIPKAVGKRKLPSSACCLAITYDTANDNLPPELAIGLESDLLSGKAGAGNRPAPWNPKKFKKFRPGSVPLPRDPQFLQYCDWFIQYTMSKSDLASPRKLLAEVAQTLNRRDWTKHMSVTKDFVVVTVELDDELRDLYWRRDLKASVPAAKLQKLKQQKLF